jgi:hypothetical protein
MTAGILLPPLDEGAVPESTPGVTVVREGAPARSRLKEAAD